ncbi:unnamed protein product [Didymodactylos carnosus]|uniref:VLIG-type G domain-containing protein n=1 Tax=Didymodactylos carnosus TaxID=1234261 RepID=A0A8S2FLI6_9BILA|nr:unnamed protein product [Didymodactylos carnosus]CAF4279803.1 unnamed protein product [Didymodactylos carnosus]
MEDLSENKASTFPSDLVYEYNDLFIRQEFQLINEMDQRVSVWHSPILSPLLQERNDILAKLVAYAKSTEDLSKKNNNSAELEKYKSLKEKLKKEKKENSELIDNKTINKGFFMRELLAIYGDEHFLSKQDNNTQGFKPNLYINSFVEYITKGNETDIIDGDNNEFNSKIVSDIFRGLDTKFGPVSKRALFVVSVIGPQSSGKSTLLNMLFGSNFQMSAGRCTKGLYASLFKTNYSNARELLVLDTEGLMSIEKANEEYDKKLTVFSMACSQIMLVNLNGELNASMKKILTISLFAANQLKMFKTRPVIMFILRNMMNLDVGLQKEMIASVLKELKEICKLSTVELSEVLDFKEEKAFFLMLTAFNKNSFYNNNKELFQKSTTNVSSIGQVWINEDSHNIGKGKKNYASNCHSILQNVATFMVPNNPPDVLDNIFHNKKDSKTCV